MSSLMAQRVLFSPHPFTPTQLAVLTGLAWHSDEDGVVIGMSLKALAVLSRVPHKRLKRVLKELTKEDAIRVNPGGGRGRHSRYELNCSIFNKTKRIVQNKGGLLRVFLDAAIDRKGALLPQLSKEGQGVVLSAGEISEKWQNPAVPEVEAQKPPVLRNTVQKRAARGRRAEMMRLAEESVRRIREGCHR